MKQRRTKMKEKKLLSMLLITLLVLSLAACAKNGGDPDNMSAEPANEKEAIEMYKTLMGEEQEILAENTELWQKVYMEADKGMAMVEDGKNYGEFLLDTIESISDEFTEDELTLLREKATRISEIEKKLTAIEEKYPETAQKALDGGMDMSTDAEAMKQFPSFEGSDLNGNKVKSSELFSKNAVTVVNFWFTTCSPCVGELADLEALNKQLAAKGGAVIGINSFTLDGNRGAISDAKNILTKKGVTYKNVWFDSKSEAGKFTSGLYTFPTTYVVDKNGNIVGEPIVGAITGKKQSEALQRLINQAIANSKG